MLHEKIEIGERISMNEGKRRNLTRGPDGHLHWNDVRNNLYSEHETKQTDYLVKFIGTMIARRKILGLMQEEVADIHPKSHGEEEQ